MSLPVPNLDDRKFQDLVDEAKRLIPVYCPEWTNHNVSDPGVALIELFAWMTEMTLFRLNQVPDAFYARMLNLIGFERFPASAARVDLTFWLTGGETPAVPIPKDTQVTTTGSAEEIRVFTTLEDVVVNAPDLRAALTTADDEHFLDVWEDLDTVPFGVVQCFPGDKPQPGNCFYLGFDESLANHVVRLTVEAASGEGIGIDPDNPPLEWEASTSSETHAGWIRVGAPRLPGDERVRDNTGGLNRTGTILLVVPDRHERREISRIRKYWLRVRVLPTEKGAPTYEKSPMIRKVTAQTVGVVVRAEHSETVTDEYLGISTGRRDQVFQLTKAPVLPRPKHEPLQLHVRLPNADRERQPEIWIEVPDFGDSDAEDQHFHLDSSTGELRFGPRIRYPKTVAHPNGRYRLHGKVPPEGAQLTLASYRTGGGDAGNVGSGTLTALRRGLAGVSGVTNLKPAEGGVDPETVENAKWRAPHSMRAGGRAVTLSDYERLTKEADPNIAAVRCLRPERPGDPVQLLVVPRIDVTVRPEDLTLGHLALTDEMYDRIAEYLDERRVLGTRIEIGEPFYQGVSVKAKVVAVPGRQPKTVAEKATRVLYERISPLRWEFDKDLNVAFVSELLEAVEGVERVLEVHLISFDLDTMEPQGSAKQVVKLEPTTLFLCVKNLVIVT